MFNNLKREIDKDFDRRNNFNKIMEKTEQKKKIHWGYVLTAASAVVVFEIIFLNTSSLFPKENLSIKSENTIAIINDNEKNREEKKWIEKKVYVDAKEVSPISEEYALTNTIDEIKQWEEMTITERFLQLEYADNNYSSRQAEVSENKLNEKLGKATLMGFDSSSNVYRETDGVIFSIKNMDSECAVAVKFDEDSNYYVYVNSYYRPETMGEFIDKLNLKENISFGTVYYKYFEENETGNLEYQNIQFYDVKNDDIWKMLFNDIELENVYNDTEVWKYYAERAGTEINISVNIPLLGYENIGITLTDQGYLLTNILDTGKGFYIGKEKVQEFIDYIIKNYDGYKIIYIYNDENNSGVEENDMNVENDSRIMTIKNDVNAVTEEYIPNNTVTNTTSAYNPNNP